MHPKFCRYSKEQFSALGLTDQFNEKVVLPGCPLQLSKQLSMVKGGFANVIDLLFDSRDGSLDNAVSKYVGENAPECVKSFVQNILLAPVKSIQSAPNDDVALEMIIPRSAQTASEMAPYLDNMRQIVSDARAAVQPQNSSSNGTD